MQTQPSNPADERGGGGRYWADRTARRRLTHLARRPSLTERRRETTLAEWYGADLATGEIEAHRSPARPLAEILDEALRDIGLGDVCLLERLRGLWPSLVGADVARRATPASLRDHLLTVEVANATWLYVLEREHRTSICAKVRAATAGEVADVRFAPPGRRHAPP
jgi:hypothetical protein